MHRLEQVTRGADAHQISRPIPRKQLGHGGRTFFTLRAAFADGKTADGVSVEGHVSDGVGALDAQIRVAGALHYAEQRLWGVAACNQAATGPPMSQFHRAARNVALNGRWHALIERHHDVGADNFLRLDAAFRAQVKHGVIDVTAKFGVVLTHGAAAGQREYLKAAGIRQYRSRPIHEAVDTAEFLENVDARPQ